jgi:hypothetical protein
MPEGKDERNRCISDFEKEIAADKRLGELKVSVLNICGRFPLYPGLNY